jgi:site-specific recombinase XerD
VGWLPHVQASAATRLFKAGLNAKQVQAWLGHHKASFTLDTYVHLLPDDLPESPFEEEPEETTTVELPSEGLLTPTLR